MERLSKSLILKIGLIAIILVMLILVGIFLYNDSFNKKIAKNSFFNATANIFYKVFWQNKYEKELLQHDLALSNIKKEQAENEADEEALARADAEKKAEQEGVLKRQAEEKAQQESVKRSQAEARAKQEEFEKKLKEEELAEKEIEEKKMNADNDNDGLTYREEQNLGSSDWSSDTDGDGIKDGEDAHPAGGDRHIAQHFEWDYGGMHWTWDYSFPSDWYDYYKNKAHGSHGVDYVTSDNKYIQEIAKMLKNEASKNGYIKSEFAVSFIQSLGYVGDDVIGYDDFPKYPLETLAEQNGDCEDTSYLAAAIIDAMNLDVVLVILPGHMAIAVAFSGNPDGSYYSLNNNRDYYYIETTAENWAFGEMPSDYENTKATIMTIPYGSRTNVYPNYNDPCVSAEAFPGYYYSEGEYFKDSSCRNSISCLPYEEFFYKPVSENFFWDSGCSQLIVDGCTQDPDYPEYFTDGYNYYYDSRCRDEAKVCIYGGDGYYFDGENLYWDNNCLNKVEVY